MTPNDDVSTLKNYSETALQPLERYATATDGADIEQRYWITAAALVTIDTDEVALEELADVDGVVRVHDDVTFEMVENDTESTTSHANALSPSSRYPWHIKQINAHETWRLTGVEGEGAAVAVLDTGVDVAHRTSRSMNERTSTVTLQRNRKYTPNMGPSCPV